MLKHLFDALFYSEEDKIYNKMKKKIMSLPAHKFTTDTELVRVKDRNGFITFYAILIKDEYVFYMKKDFLNEFGENNLWPLMSTYKFGKLTKDVTAKKLWKTNLKDIDIIKNRCVLASQE
nr:MAG TPA: hypothetical protein [Caudoviricetes sp.]